MAFPRIEVSKMGMDLTIEIYDEEDAINLIAAMKELGGALLEYLEGDDE